MAARVWAEAKLSLAGYRADYETKWNYRMRTSFRIQI